jgi:hypothetical protein
MGAHAAPLPRREKALQKDQVLWNVSKEQGDELLLYYWSRTNWGFDLLCGVEENLKLGT